MKQKQIWIFLITFLICFVGFYSLFHFLMKRNVVASVVEPNAICLAHETADSDDYNLYCWCNENNQMRMIQNFSFKSNTKFNKDCNKQCADLCSGKTTQTEPFGHCEKIAQTNPVVSGNKVIQQFNYKYGCKCENGFIDGFEYESASISDSECNDICNDLCVKQKDNTIVHKCIEAKPITYSVNDKITDTKYHSQCICGIMLNDSETQYIDVLSHDVKDLFIDSTPDKALELCNKNCESVCKPAIKDYLLKYNELPKRW
ncbi:MAG: hypothetical protein MJ158_00290 [Alphaproteobacteria bacterium]|nr:hypothetical protein [Alphaproteobacteria bacterium]